MSPRSPCPRRPGLLLPLLGATLLSSPPPWAQEQPPVPPWAEGWAELHAEANARGSLRVGASLQSPVLSGGRTEVLALIQVGAVAFPPAEVPPLSVALVLDRSASMRGAQIRAAKRVAEDLLSHLGAQDRLSIVWTSSDAVTFPSGLVTLENRGRMRAFVAETAASGGSNISAGLKAAREELLAHREGYVASRIILVSDGQANEGLADDQGLAEMARAYREEDRIQTSTLSLGVDANRELMTGIAREGWGFFGTVGDDSRSPRVGIRQKLDLGRRAAERTQLTLRVPSFVRVMEVLLQDAEVDRERRQVTVDFHEVGPGEVLELLVRLEVDAPRGATELDVGVAEVHFWDVLAEQNRSAITQLQARVGEASEASAALDPDVLLQATQALVYRRLAQAELAASEKDRRSALSLLGEARALIARSRQILGQQALAEEETATEHLEATLGLRAPKKNQRPPRGRSRRG